MVIGGVEILVAVGNTGAVRVRRPDLSVRHAAAFLMVARVAARAVQVFLKIPAQPALIVVVRAEVHVLAEGNDGNVDIFGLMRGAFKLTQQIMSGGLKSRHLAGARHRTGIVEHKGDPQARVTPGRNRGRADVNLIDPDDAEEVSVDDAGAVKREVRSINSRRVGRRDCDVIYFRVLVESVERVGSLRLQHSAVYVRRIS